MCGIAGFRIVGRSAQENLQLIERITAKLAHRGPDGQGCWQNADGSVNLGHRRLSILDLSPTGAQPMRLAGGRLAITFNGEIYNYLELRERLLACGRHFLGSSDTEVLLHALDEWGVDKTLPQLNGMFAFALWDSAADELVLARDRFGEKPLYFTATEGGIAFASELSALMALPFVDSTIDPEAVALYTRFNYVPWPYSIYRHVKKLGPGQFLRCRPGHGSPVIRTYWSLAESVEAGRTSPVDPTDPSMLDSLDAVLRRAVKSRMVADVPLGAFLSGGIDSSTIVALMQAQSARPVKTFTIGFNEAAYNEAKDAAKVAQHLGTDHHELYVSSNDCLEVIARLPQMFDEPFADSSQIPTALVSAFARKHVTVALSGDAGDELFGGYNRYFGSLRLWPVLQRIPLAARQILARNLLAISPARWDRLSRLSNTVLPSRFGVKGGGEKVHKIAAAMGARTSDELYRSFVSLWQEPGQLLMKGAEPDLLGEQFERLPDGMHFVERMMYVDTLTYLPSDILCKVDRASMASSLEARVPFLDPDVVRFAWSLPFASKVAGGVGKLPLRSILRRYVPPALFERPKVGFGVPIGDWLRGPLRPWAEEMLSETTLARGGWFRPEVVRREWADHLSGKYNRQHSLWGVLMLQSWFPK